MEDPGQHGNRSLEENREGLFLTLALWLIVVCGALSIVYGVITTQQLLAADAALARMQEISAAVREGALAYLKR